MMHKINVVFQFYGIDYEGPLPKMEEDGDVHVPAISTSISEDEYFASCMATLRHNAIWRNQNNLFC